jgi:hypothetical protein
LGSHGRDEAERLTRFESSNLAAVEKLVKSEEIDCDFVRTLAYDVFFREEDWAVALAKVNSLRRAGVQSALDLTISNSSEEAERVSVMPSLRRYGNADLSARSRTSKAPRGASRMPQDTYRLTSLSSIYWRRPLLEA